MVKTHSKRQRNIKSKLMAAICMLLVSTIMMVSSTYAWFTLSTAPEVTGITTSVGANGNLEMALLPLSGKTEDITSSAGDSVKDWSEKNTTWGNLVNLSKQGGADYGLDKIILYPAALNLTDTGAISSSSILMTPSYGSDGRVDKLLENTVTSTYDSSDDSFPNNTNYGVRAVGTASGMTDRQLAYRNARSAANTYMAQAKTMASKSLNTNGNALANIAIAHGADSTAKHSQNDVAALLAIVDDLLGYDGADGKHVTGVLEYIENAYIQYIYAYSASKAVTDESAYTGIKTLIDSGKSLNEIMAALPVVPTGLDTYVNSLNATITAVTTAKTKLEALVDESATTPEAKAEKTIEWGTISTPLYRLADVDAMKINGYAASTVKDNMSAIVNSVASQGLTVTIASGGGVYADVADHCGDFEAQVTIEKVEYNGLVLENMDARMKTATTVSPVHLAQVASAVEVAGAPEGAGGTTMPITDTFGYIIDLAFRTNAASSNLLLQTAGIDRIYGTDGTEETMGGGAYMTFTPTTTDFTAENVRALMSSIRIVFFDPGSYSVLANARMDMNEATTETDDVTVKAPIYLYDEIGSTVTTTTYVEAKYVSDGADGFVEATSGATHALLSDGTYAPATHVASAGYVAAGSATATHALLADGSYAPATHIQKVTYAEAAADETATHVLDADSGEYRLPNEGETATHVAKTEIVAAGSGEVATYAEDADGSYVLAKYVAGTVYTEASTGATHAAETSESTATTATKSTDAVITALTQNTAQRVSVLVYLDGESITNADVAATASTSVTGTMNLQFASSATLVPMEYTPLMDPNKVGADSDDEGTGYTASLSADSAAGVTLSSTTITEGQDYSFTLNGTDTAAYTYAVSATVGGNPVAVTESNGTYTIASTAITGNVVVTVTATAV